MLKENYRELKKSGVLSWWDKGYLGENITVLVLDDEGDRLPWFDKNIITLFNNHEGVGHNTFVTQTVREVLPRAKVIMTNFFGKNSNREEIIQWIKNNKEQIDLINISQSVATYDFEKFREFGIPIVCSSGNGGRENKVSHPANLDFTIAAGGENEKTGIASYSNGGKELDCVGYTGIFVYRENKRVIQFQGTSCASVFVCGMLGLVAEHLKKSGYRKPTSKQIKKFIHEHCIDILEEGFDFKSGYGRFVLPDNFDETYFNKYFIKEGEVMRRFRQYTVNQYLELLKDMKIDREIKEIHLHHTWRPDKKDYEKASNKESVIYSIYKFHTKSNGWDDIGQHISLAPDGTVWDGRDVNIDPASIKGRNKNALAIEKIGNFDIGYDKLEGLQLESLVKLLRGLFDIFKEAKLVFHAEYSSKTCPGSSIQKEELLAMVNGQKYPAKLSDWAKEAYEWILEEGISDGTDPKGLVTREHFWTMLYRYHQTYGK
ncbi:MAG: S8 family serine peptidase [Clostridia bacterium]|nr:S8 family serine peptidase [Clostridia bacterium]